MQREASLVELGAKSLTAVLTQRLRISDKEAQHRLSEATELGPRTALNGEPLAPLLAETAAAQSAGTVGPEHVTVIRSFLGPDDLGQGGEEVGHLPDQDGPEPDDAERARKRFIRLGRQQADGMTPSTGLLAAPGMCNSDDCTTPNASSPNPTSRIHPGSCVQRSTPSILEPCR